MMAFWRSIRTSPHVLNLAGIGCIAARGARLAGTAPHARHGLPVGSSPRGCLQAWNICAGRCYVKIIRDTREQTGYDFVRQGGEVVEAALPTGDYSIPGLKDSIAIERKSIDDLIGCLTGGRERFERELQRSMALDRFYVVVEASTDDVSSGRYRSKMKPHAALQSIIAMSVRYGVSFVWAGSRAGGEYITFHILRHYLKNAQDRLKRIADCAA